MTTASELETDLLATLVERKHACLEQLLELGRQQCALVDAGDMTTLLQVLSVKQQLVGQLTAVERQLDPFRLQVPDDRHWRSPTLRQRCGEQIARAEQLLAGVLTYERQAEQRLQQRRDESAARLSGAHHALNARGAYRDEPQRTTGQLDILSP